MYLINLLIQEHEGYIRFHDIKITKKNGNFGEITSRFCHILLKVDTIT